MRVLAQERKQTQHVKPKSSATFDRTNIVLSQKGNSTIRLQRAIGNQAMQQLLQAGANNLEVDSARALSTRLENDFPCIQDGPKAHMEAIRKIAQNGIAGAARPLPYLDQIQRYFGPKHDLRRVKANVGGKATESSRQMSAEAYTSGETVAFRGTPSLHIAAHEAAHVIQQRAGVQLQNGLGQTNDNYERHAEQVANEVVAGRSAEDILDRDNYWASSPGCIQKQAVQFWGHEHKDFTRRAVDRWNEKHPVGTFMHIPEHLKTRIIDCSDDPDYSGRVLTGTLSDLGIYYDFIVGGKKRRHKEYAEADPAKKKKLYDAARKSICASEGPSHGEGNRPRYGSGGSAVNRAWMMSQIKWADRLSLGGFMSPAGAGQLGDAMHCAQDRGSHCEGNRHEGHDDVRDKLGIDDYNTDDPAKNIPGKQVADDYSDEVLVEFAKLRLGRRSSA